MKGTVPDARVRYKHRSQRRVPRQDADFHDIDAGLVVTSASDLAATIAKAIIVFASTNVDDLLLLTILFADEQLSPRSIILGQYLGVAVLVLIGAAAGAAAVTIPTGWISLLGALPLALGLHQGINVLRTRASANDGEPTRGRRFAGRAQILTVTGLTVANGGDNLGAYVPIFAVEPRAIVIYAAVFAVMLALWCALGFKLVNNRAVGNKIRRYGYIARPIVLTLLGIHILAGLRAVL